MADYTENLNLKKPARTDYFSVADFNGNADIIDSAVGSIDTALDGKLNTDFSNVSGGAIPIANGGTGATTASGALTNLGVDTALDGKLNTDFSNISGGAIAISNGGTGATTASGALTNLGVDTALSNKADKDLSNVTGTLPVIAGGTGATTASVALSNLGIDTALDNKLNKDFSNASGGVIPITSGGTGNSAGYIRTGQKSNTTIGSNATCEGNNTTASGNYSHAEGYYTTASGNGSHAEGDGTTASSSDAHAEGYSTTASGKYSHAEGDSTTASENGSHAEGRKTTAKGEYSHAAGYYTVANYAQTVVGMYNVEKGSTQSTTTDNGYFIVGCGTSSSSRANCLRATESKVYGKTYSSSGADYAEMFEWLDGNIANEDRIGKFVTLDGDKIKLATSQDDYILGVVSGNPSVIGDSHSDQWAYMFEQDIFGRPIYETVTIPEEKDDDGNIIVEEHTEEQLKVSKQYDNTQPYIARDKRKEWVAVGLLGKLICIDDGTAEINGYVKPNENSIATHSEEKTKYRVMKRIDETHIQIMIL